MRTAGCNHVFLESHKWLSSFEVYQALADGSWCQGWSKLEQSADADECVCVCQCVCVCHSVCVCVCVCLLLFVCRFIRGSPLGSRNGGGPLNTNEAYRGSACSARQVSCRLCVCVLASFMGCHESQAVISEGIRRGHMPHVDFPKFFH